MLTFQWPFKLKKRQVSALGAPSEWIPFSNNFPPTQATRLATVGGVYGYIVTFYCKHH